MKYFLMYVFMAFALLGCAKTEDTEIKAELLTLFDSAIKNNNATFQLSKLSLNWDSLLIVFPYSDVKRIKFSDRINTDILDQTDIQSRDDVCILVFLKDDKIISYVEMSRVYDFGKLSADKLYSKSQLFKLVKDPLSKSRYVIKEE